MKIKIDIEEVTEISVERLHPFKEWVAKVLNIPVARLCNYKLRGVVIHGTLWTGELVTTEYGEMLYVLRGDPIGVNVELITTRAVSVMPQYFKLGTQMVGRAWETYREG